MCLFFHLDFLNYYFELNEILLDFTTLLLLNCKLFQLGKFDYQLINRLIHQYSLMCFEVILSLLHNGTLQFIQWFQLNSFKTFHLFTFKVITLVIILVLLKIFKKYMVLHQEFYLEYLNCCIFFFSWSLQSFC